MRATNSETKKSQELDGTFMLTSATKSNTGPWDGVGVSCNIHVENLQNFQPTSLPKGTIVIIYCILTAFLGTVSYMTMYEII